MWNISSDSYYMSFWFLSILKHRSINAYNHSNFLGFTFIIPFLLLFSEWYWFSNAYDQLCPNSEHKFIEWDVIFDRFKYSISQLRLFKCSKIISWPKTTNLIDLELIWMISTSEFLIPLKNIRHQFLTPTNCYDI